ncbi:MAG: hypothetical protein AB7F35_00615 [Acetobacteraceae bacterium]
MPAQDLYATLATGLDSPAVGGEAVTPSDSVDLTKESRCLRVGGAGNLAVVMSDGSNLTITGCLAGEWLPICVTRVKATGTTATNITSFY